MKTQAMHPLSQARDELQLAEEVLLTIRGAERRLLAPLAIVLMANGMQIKEKFELRRVADQQVLARYDGSKLEGRADVLASIPQVSEFLDLFGRELGARLYKELQK